MTEVLVCGRRLTRPTVPATTTAQGERGAQVHCPFCRHGDSRVIDSRTSEDGTSIRRRRQCPACGRRFSTLETSSLTVVKRSGAQEPFSREKIIAGVRKACQGRPVSDDDLALLAQQVEESVRSTGSALIEAHEIGLAILGPLRALDEVAYLRFASVYSNFTSLEDFEAAITALRQGRGAENEVSAADARAPVAAGGAEPYKERDHAIADAGEPAGSRPLAADQGGSATLGSSAT